MGAMKSFYKARYLERGPSPAFFLGHLLTEKGKPDMGVKYLEEAIRKNPRDEAADFDRADAYEQIGRTNELLGHPQRAEKAYRLALSTRPDSPVASNNLAGLLSERGALKGANSILEKLLTRYPRLDMAWVTLGANRLRSRNLEGARVAFETALNINPNNVPSRENLSSMEKMVLMPRTKITDLPNGVKVSEEEMKRSLAEQRALFSNSKRV